MSKKNNMRIIAVMLALLFYFVGSHLISFTCSIFESVLLSSTDAYIALLKKRGSSVALLLEKLKAEIDRPLAAILTLNTISHTVGAAGVGASIVEVFGDKWFALGSILLTLTMLYWTEMLPKTIGAVYWKTLAPICAKPIQWMIYLTFPFVMSFNFFARFLSRGKQIEKITEEDIRVALETGARTGVIEESEQDMVENIFRLGDRRVGVLMRPRIDIDWLDIEDSIEEIRQDILSSPHHIFPVTKGGIDTIVGIIHSKDLLEKAMQGENLDLTELVQSPLFVNEHQRVFELLELFKRQHQSFALVTDEYGSIQGVITLGDIMHAIIKDVAEERNHPIQTLNNRSWLVDGKMPIDEFKEFFHIEKLPDEENFFFRTVSGLCMTRLGKIPKKGDSFQINALRLEVVLARRNRVERVLVSKLS